jgi:dihydrofolate reductase
MAKLIYSAIASADGYVEDAAGSFDWAAPDDELLRFVNDLERPAGTYLYGRRMYETMLYWETARPVPGQPPSWLDFAGIWQAADKIVFSKTLASESSARTRIERSFDPGVVRQLKSASEDEITVGGADLAGQATKAGLVDELRLIVVPVVTGGGKRALPDGVRSDLELLDTRRFTSGAVYLRYRIKLALATARVRSAPRGSAGRRGPAGRRTGGGTPG